MRLLLLCCLLIPLYSAAQDNKPWAGFCFDASVFGGKVIKHTEKFRAPVPDLSRGIDLNFQWKTYGRKDWEQRRRYPTLGIAIAYTDYGIDSVYGKCISIYPNIEIPLISGHKFQWTVKIGDGAGFVTRKYSRQAPLDTLNNAIGSTLNDYAAFMSDIRYRANEHWDIQAGINFSHISNASSRQPNLGVNLLGAHVGVKYFPVTSKVHPIARKLAPLSNRWLLQLRYTMAFTQSNAALGPVYPVYVGTAYASRRWISKNKFFAGLDYSYHQQIHAFLRNNVFVEPGTERRQSTKIAALVGNEFLLGRVGVILQAGYYLQQAYQTQGKVYQKVGGAYYFIQREKGFLKEAYLCAFLKTHLSTAELAEFGAGFSL